MRRTEKYAAMTKDAAQRRPSALLRAVSLSNGLSNGRWTFYEAVNFRMVKNAFQRAKENLGSKLVRPDLYCFFLPCSIRPIKIFKQRVDPLVFLYVVFNGIEMREAFNCGKDISI